MQELVNHATDIDRTRSERTRDINLLTGGDPVCYRKRQLADILGFCRTGANCEKEYTSHSD
jgi:hypothetical protein